jgi:hypothetical protein
MQMMGRVLMREACQLVRLNLTGNGIGDRGLVDGMLQPLKVSCALCLCLSCDDVMRAEHTNSDVPQSAIELSDRRGGARTGWSFREEADSAAPAYRREPLLA